MGVKIYGSLDRGVECVTHTGASKTTLSHVPSTTANGRSVIGLDFRRNVGVKYAAVGKAEIGIFLDSGSSGQGSRTFARQLYVGADTPLCSITFGSQYTMLFYRLHGSDILGPNIYGLGSIDAYIPNARADNSVVWRAKLDKLALGTHYSFGCETANTTVPSSAVCSGEDATDASRCRGWSAMACYDDPKFAIAAAIGTQRGGTCAQASFFNSGVPIAMSSDGDKDRRMSVNGYVRFSALTQGAGCLGRKVDTRNTDVKQYVTWLIGEYAL
jgi:predicted porin